MKHFLAILIAIIGFHDLARAEKVRLDISQRDIAVQALLPLFDHSFRHAEEIYNTVDAENLVQQLTTAMNCELESQIVCTNMGLGFFDCEFESNNCLSPVVDRNNRRRVSCPRGYEPARIINFINPSTGHNFSAGNFTPFQSLCLRRP